MEHKDNLPLVSIVAVCFNHERYAVETLNSIINQTYANIELIIMDDCSKDNSVQVIESWIKENKVKCTFIPHKKNQGLCKTLNEALTYCNGKYLQMISCDDILYVDKIKKQVCLLENCSNKIALIYTDSTLIDENGISLGFTNFDSMNKKGQKMQKRGFVYYDLLKYYFLNTPTILIRREVFDTIGKFDESLILEDLDFYLRVSKKFHVDFLNEPTVHYRVLKDSLYRKENHEKIYTYLYTYKKHLNNSDVRAKKIVLEKISIYGMNGYLKGLKNMNLWMFYRFIHKKDFTSFFLMLGCMLGVKYSTLQRIKVIFQPNG